MRIARLTKASKLWIDLDALAEWLFYDGLIRSDSVLSQKRSYLNKGGYSNKKTALKARKRK